MSDHFCIESEGGRVVGYTVQCRVCERKILVEMVMFRTIHHQTPLVTCAGCLTLQDDFREAQPAISKQLDEWRKEE